MTKDAIPKVEDNLEEDDDEDNGVHFDLMNGYSTGGRHPRGDTF